jgi:hypothetical protein
MIVLRIVLYALIAVNFIIIVFDRATNQILLLFILFVSSNLMCANRRAFVFYIIIVMRESLQIVFL